MGKSKEIMITQSQRQAADPTQSVWVTANAGTGKTKVLTDRILRLLLDGTAPEKILALTYTNAASAEMVTRLQKELAKWVKLSEYDLKRELNGLIGRAPSEDELFRAQQLFIRVLEAPEGVRIMTLHSLCQSLLKRFALEAGVSPYFRLMENSQSSILLTQARQRLFTQQRLPKDIEGLSKALTLFAERLSEDQLDTLLDEIIKKRKILEIWFNEDAGKGAAKIRHHIQAQLGIAQNETRETILAEYYETIPQRIKSFKLAADILRASSSRDADKAPIYDEWIQKWELDSHNITEDDFKSWARGFLNKNLDKPFADSYVITGSLAKKHIELAEILIEERDRIFAVMQKLFALEAAEWSLATLSLGEALLALYDRLKRDSGYLDFDDLITQTHQLFQKPDIAPWILYKLDNGLEHLLVDEAQDTSPIQWEIIKQLAEEFFSGHSANKAKRTLFVVGDEKQSIYSFQGADPRKFLEMKQHFAQKIQAAGEAWQPVSLELSFRSTPAVLRLVDKVFSDENARDGVLELGADIHHQPDRSEQPGRVELWPPVIAQKEDEARIPWQVPDSKNARQTVSADALLANQISHTIGEWLGDKRFIAAKGRAIEPSDILILVRSRNPFYYRLIRTLKNANIPVAGEDRLKLLDQIAVMDVLALADFLLLPQDDLSLACVLKSPFFDVSEDALFDLAYGREKMSLWDAVIAKRPDIADTLKRWLNQVDYLRPYELFAYLLEAQGGREKLVARLGVHMHDPLNELLKLARDYEQLHPPSLQGFMHAVRRDEIIIKREMEAATGQVRVMTVHHSKGLQSPIVILPDTLSIGKAQDQILWQEDALFLPQDGAKNSGFVQALKEQRKADELREHRRLLYVALTRAADELYIGGYLGGNSTKINKDSWYGLVAAAMQKIGTEEHDDHWILEDKFKPVEADETKSDGAASPLSKTRLPSWIHAPMPVEPLPPRPLTPSRPELKEPAADSPLMRKQAKRGTLMHHLLEILPQIAPEQRAASAEILLKKQGVLAQESAQWIAEVMQVLNDPQFAAVFAEGSLAEVPVTALLPNGQVLAGQIDRLVISPEKVLIVDYKTSIHVPESASQLPDYFAQQMQVYVNAIAPIYPSKRIEAAILWTAKPVLMPLAISPN